jgi:hypothetical protein
MKDYLPGVNELIARMIEEPSLDDSPIMKQWSWGKLLYYNGIVLQQ